jgi:hypothetical protein
LQSCDYRLADSPGAASLVMNATRALVDAGDLTQTQIAAGGTTYHISDDPTRPDQVFFTVLLAVPVDVSRAANPTAYDALLPYVVSMDAGTGAVNRVLGRANWFVGK